MQKLQKLVKKIHFPKKEQVEIMKNKHLKRKPGKLNVIREKFLINMLKISQYSLPNLIKFRMNNFNR